MSDAPEANSEAPEIAPEAVKNTQRPYGKRNPDAVIEERRKRLYKRQLTGLPVRQLVLDHADRESIAEATAWRDWEAVSAWNEQDWKKDREAIVSRLQGMRLRAIEARFHNDHIGRVMPAILGLHAILRDARNGCGN